ncbi:MAG: DUF881 domain-containing protein [Actinomycetaceae bacterium]|nr:DUF881 domain-containing protein [Actinomycetaceae bacterium]
MTSEGGRHGRPRNGSDESTARRVWHFFTRFFVLLVAGLLFAMSATLRPPEGSRYESDLTGLVTRKEGVVSSLRDQNADLSQQIDELVEAVPGKPIVEAELPLRTDIVGPGVVVTLTDAPVPEPLPRGVTADDLVIHQQDIEAVFNALWQGGAEVVSVQGHQVLATTQVSCVGNVINIDGHLYSPPYEIAAIGPSKDMLKSLNEDPLIEIIQGYVARYGLGFKVKEESQILVKAAAQKPDFSYVKVKGDDPDD